MKLIPDAKTTLELFGDSSSNRYKVPSFQRDYAWGTEQVKELWSDLLACDTSDENTFLGQLILLNKRHESEDGHEKDVLEIIDGQQRLTTLSILILACRDYSRNNGWINHAEDLQRLIAFTNRRTLEVSGTRIIPASNIKKIFEFMISNGAWTNGNFPKSIGGKSVLKEVRKIRPVYEYFWEELKNLKGLQEFIKFKTALYNCYFIVLEITEKTEAFEIFERTNARGIPLNIADLLKNALFAKEDLNSLSAEWDEIIGNAGTTIQRMIKYYAILHHGLQRKTQIYKKLHGTVYEMQTNDFVDSLYGFSVFYKNSIAASNIEEFKKILSVLKWSFLRGNVAYCKSVYRSIEALNFFGITQTIPVIYAGLYSANRLEAEIERSTNVKYTEISKLFADAVYQIEKHHFVNNVILTSVGHDIEVFYAEIAKELYNCHTEDEFKKIVKKLTKGFKERRQGKKDSFVSEFTQIIYENTPEVLGLISYIFDRLQNLNEKGAQIRDIFVIDPEVRTRDYSIDHFWEQSRADSFDENIEAIHNIGNLSVIPRHTNSDDINGKDVQEKSKILKERNYEGLKYINELVFSYENNDVKMEWNEQKIKERALKLAEYAFDTVWAI